MRTLRAGTLVLGLVLASAWGEPVWAWGEPGHTIVCEIALQELNDKARGEVKRPIALDPKFDTFAAACTWPDNPRQRDNEHFINAPRSQTRFKSAKCPVAATTCLFTAIPADLKVLRLQRTTRRSWSRSSSWTLARGHPPTPPRLVLRHKDVQLQKALEVLKPVQAQSSPWRSMLVSSTLGG